jgi:UPF0271 protein
MDLNADLGEGCPWDEALLERVTSASISCGAHAGDPEAITSTLRAAKARGVVVGAHPGYDDRASFGRREQSMTTAQVAALVGRQLCVLDALAAELDVTVRFVKPHGALYNQAQRDDAIAAGIIEAVSHRGLPVLGLPDSRLASLAAAAGLRYVPEGFADRRYGLDGHLVPRTQPGAVLEDSEAIEEQVRRLTREGNVVTLCIHGDNPQAVRLAERVRAALASMGVQPRSFV